MMMFWRRWIWGLILRFRGLGAVEGGETRGGGLEWWWGCDVHG